MKEYRLGSAPNIYAPGVVDWAINGYAFRKDRKAMLHVISEGWAIPESAAKALLSKTSPYTIEGEAVVFKA